MPWSHGKKLSKRHSDKINDPEIWKAKHTETNVSREQAQASARKRGWPELSASLPAAAQSVNCSPIVANNNSFQTVDWCGKRIKNTTEPKKRNTYMFLNHYLQEQHRSLFLSALTPYPHLYHGSPDVAESQVWTLAWWHRSYCFTHIALHRKTHGIPRHKLCVHGTVGLTWQSWSWVPPGMNLRRMREKCIQMTYDFPISLSLMDSKCISWL